MDSLISFLCLCSFFAPTEFGLGLTLLLERFFGILALTMIVNSIAQAALFWFWRAQRQRRSMVQ